MKSHRIEVSILCLVASIATHESHAAMLEPTGGSLISLGSSTPITGQGIFSVAGTQQALYTVAPGVVVERTVAWGDATVDAGPGRLSVLGSARGSADMAGQSRFGSVNGTMGLDLASATTFWLDWKQTEGNGQEATATLMGVDGTALNCVGFFGCTIGDGPVGGWNPDGQRVKLTLGPGHYDLSFGTVSDYAVGHSVGNSFSMELTPVPIPAAFYLLLSGLGLVGSLRKRAFR